MASTKEEDDNFPIIGPKKEAVRSSSILDFTRSGLKKEDMVGNLNLIADRTKNYARGITLMVSEKPRRSEASEYDNDGHYDAIVNSRSVVLNQEMAAALNAMASTLTLLATRLQKAPAEQMQIKLSHPEMEMIREGMEALSKPPTVRASLPATRTEKIKELLANPSDFPMHPIHWSMHRRIITSEIAYLAKANPVLERDHKNMQHAVSLNAK